MSLFKKKAKTAKPPASEAGERLQLTVLFYDIVGSTSLSDAADPETLREALAQIHEAAAAAVSDNGGSVEQVMGDGGMAYFGYPEVREDAALSAVQSGLALLEAVADIDGAPGLRVGIATSIVVVPERADALATGKLGAVGVAPNLAARLENAAETNTLLVSPATFSLTRFAFEYEPVDGLSLKGFPDVTRAWRAMGAKSASTRLERERGESTETSGRTEEIAQLDEMWSHAANGFGRAVLIEGEPGIGKSHLAAHLMRSAAGARVVVMQAMPRTEGEALFSLIQMYEAAYEADLDPQLVSAAEVTAERLGILEEDETLSADARRDAIVSAVCEAIEGLTRDKPLLLVLEDLHWADEVTLAVMERLTLSARSSRMLVAITTRPGGGTDLLREHASAIDLQQVDETASRYLILRVADQPLSPVFLKWIIEKADGNPLFLIELTRHVCDVLAAGGTLGALAGAEVGSLRDLLATRLESAGRAKRIAKIASVLGRSYPYALLSRLAKDVEHTELDSDLQRLLDHGLKEAQNNGYAYAFQHALIRDVAYDSQLQSVRKSLHAEVVAIVDADPSLADDVPDILLAEHCLAADMTLRGLTLLTSVAEDAIRRSALTAPREMLERVLAEADRLSDSAERDHLLLKAISLLGPLVTLLDSHTAAAPLYELGQALYFDMDVAARAPYFPVLWGWWFTATDLKEQARRGDVLINDVPDDADAESRLQALHCGWATLFDSGSHARCLHAIDTGLELFDEDVAAHGRYLYGHDARVCGLGERALCCWFTGQLSESSEAISACETWADETQHLSSQLHGLDIAIQLAVFNHDLDEIDRILTKIATLSGASAAPVVEAKRQIFSGWIATRRGESGQLATVEAGLAALRSFGVLEDTPFYADILAEVADADGDPGRAVAVIDAEIAESEASGLTYWLAELYRRKAMLVPSEEAVIALDRGLDVATEQAAHHLVLRNMATRIDLNLSVPKDVAQSALAEMSDSPLREKVRGALGI